MIFITQSKLGYPLLFIGLTLSLGLIASLPTIQLKLLLLLGIALGGVLNYFMFGFSGSWRECILHKRTIGIRAQIIMLLIATLLFSPLLSWQSGNDYQGLVRPISLSVVLGAFLFGIGMQLARNCSSGTLNRVGQLAPLSFVTFFFLFVGGTIGAYFFEYWSNWPAFSPFSLTINWLLLGLLIQVGLFALAYFALITLEFKYHDRIQPIWHKNHFHIKDIYKTNPLLIAGVLLACLNFGVLLTAGQPWSVATIFTLWSFKTSDFFGLGLDWAFWDISSLYDTRMAIPLLHDPISLTTLGVLIGSLLVTLANIRPYETNRMNKKQLLLSVAGGILMGFGATLSYGCNIGAFFSGIASGSIHGWVWIIFAVFGNFVALKIIKT